MMPVVPSENEEEYFARRELELRRKRAQEQQAQVAAEDREQARALHYMKCPKCGMPLEEITFGEVRADKCFACEGIWFDKGEVERIQKQDGGFVSRLLRVFGS